MARLAAHQCKAVVYGSDAAAKYGGETIDREDVTAIGTSAGIKAIMGPKDRRGSPGLGSYAGIDAIVAGAALDRAARVSHANQFTFKGGEILSDEKCVGSSAACNARTVK